MPIVSAHAFGSLSSATSFWSLDAGSRRLEPSERPPPRMPTFSKFVLHRGGLFHSHRQHSNRGTNTRNGFLIAASLSLVAGTCASPALAGWGCGSQLYPG